MQGRGGLPKDTQDLFIENAFQMNPPAQVGINKTQGPADQDLSLFQDQQVERTDESFKDLGSDYASL